ncbi:MAG: HEAT repeat domain-containing protein [Methylocystaceae bacterium]|nr:HEAT repeat domain-containing protein [Methylocystaceae bacterium]
MVIIFLLTGWNTIMRDDKGRFLTGQSGNPTGRPKIIGELKELAAQHTPQAIQTLADIMNDAEAPPAARVAASTALLDRVYGRPSQNIEAKVETVDAGKAMAEVLMALTAKAKARRMTSEIIDMTPCEAMAN